METKTIILIVCGAALAQVSMHGGQPNDNFANRIVLSGDDIVFKGDLTGSTIETNEPVSMPLWPDFPATHSVWWSWTAMETKPVTIVALNYSEDTYVQGVGEWTSALAVYAGTNVFGPPPPASTNLFWLDAAFDKASLSFPGIAGTTYQLQFLGTHATLAVIFHLLATNPPVVLEPPASQTTYPGGSALFTVIATGSSPVTYQWRREGVDLVSRTSPMLSLNNVTLDQAGAYSVVLSNATGVITSAPANLRITSTAVSPLLIAASGHTSNSFGFTLVAEEGRYYRIETSTDLVDWHHETSFSSLPVVLISPAAGAPKVSVVYAGSSTNVFSIPADAKAKFVRASLYTAPNEICNSNLKQIRFAKALWLRSHYPQSRQAVPTISDLSPEIAGIYCPVAGGGPADGSYILNDVVTLPTCAIVNGHVLEEPR